ncbi:Methenyltetrahydrofolate cyclohydrolase [Heracleum sosnowskyi]|uniref:Methenyltetrahydrofolate cyclohydrolase n=1 Tax=Heracleum sosnowskyi TaxID=360622 RepID=A0AAD8I498_9APIA|nr:Methenyltetrahydrofolate cyclohydrolase [Heracleum sosnowskyi]
MIPRLWRFSIRLQKHPPLHYFQSSPFSKVANGKTCAIIDGKSIAKDIKSRVADEINKMKNCIGKCPGLGIVLVGKREDSNTFVRLKLRACQEVGIASFLEQLPEDCSQDEVFDVVSKLNDDPDVHGVIVQLPLPQHLNEDKIVEIVSPEKDVDGLHPLNIGMLAMGRDPLFIPCAPKACIELLLRQGIEIASSRVVVLGKSKISGLPVSLLLQSHLATVSTVHACSENPEHITRQADIIVSDVGIPNMVRGHWLKPEAVVIDMGAKQVKDPSRQRGFRITGDVCYEEAIKVVSAITPVPGGVGPVTISMLLSNTLESAKRAFKFT